MSHEDCTPSNYEYFKSEAHENKVYCYCVFQFNDTLKKLGFKFDGKYKLWYIPVEKFTFEVFEASLEVRFANRVSGGETLLYYYVYYRTKQEVTEDYKEFMEKKERNEKPKQYKVTYTSKYKP